jgi:hypothetical protein
MNDSEWVVKIVSTKQDTHFFAAKRRRRRKKFQLHGFANFELFRG